ncbi:MAG: hypothetical protein JJE27_08360, partial [Thermoleophilia bacterium]|nr:hypothetical protein [Thermoleophilia bacterium]
LTIKDSATGSLNGDGAVDGAIKAAYPRYELNASGISPMPIPGMPGGSYVSTGIEHDEQGHPAYSPAVHQVMQDKRWKKIEPLATTGRVTVNGPEKAAVGILGWGSTEGAAIEAIEILNAAGVSAASFFPRIVSPLPVERIKQWAAGMDAIIVPEVNYTGQFARMIRAECEIPVLQLNQISGMPFSAQQIADFIIQNVKTAAGATA